MSSVDSAPTLTSQPKSRRGDIGGLLWILVVCFAYFSPALKDGASFGPTDIGEGLSLLTRVPGLVLHDNINGDLITQGAPWNLLDWRLVHSGQFPLWNDLSGTGLPHFLNFESAVLSLPTLVGYLFPLNASFLVTAICKMLLAGTGAYVACRLLSCRPLAASFGATIAMLAGSFSGWLGWAVSGPMAWTGWLLAGVIICYRRRGAAGVVLLAVATAFAIYAGMPESDLLVAIGLGAVCIVTGLVTLGRDRSVPVLPLVRIAAGLVAGVALAAPLVLPGIPILLASNRKGTVAATALPVHAAALLFAQGYYGLPIKGSYFFGPVNYFETAAYVGIPAIVLALVGLVAWRRRPVAIGLAVAILGSLLVIYRFIPNDPVPRLLQRIGLGTVDITRLQGVMELLIAVLAALGLEAFFQRPRGRDVVWTWLAGSLAVAAVLGVLWHGVDNVYPAAATVSSGAAKPTAATLSTLRRSSLIWPSAEAAMLLLIGAALVSPGRLRRALEGTRRMVEGRLGRVVEGRRAVLVGAAVLAAESTFLVFAGVGINSYFQEGYPVTPAVAALQRDVGSAMLGLDGTNVSCPTPPVTSLCGFRQWEGLGLYPEINIAYGVDELAAHDPVIPAKYLLAWPVAGAGQSIVSLSIFAPSVDTVALARRYGVGYVLAAPGRPAPAGMEPVASIDGMELYKVPGSARFTLSDGSVRSVRHPDDATYTLELETTRASVLTMRITNVPGWHVTTARGRSLRVSPADGGAFMKVRVPAGTTSLRVWYWPGRLTIGIAVAVAAALALVLYAAFDGLFRRRLRRHGTS